MGRIARDDDVAGRDGQAAATGRRTFPIVGVGASAGGLEALEEFVAAIPEEFGLAVVVIQHLNPTHESILAPLLQRHTPLEVRAATDGTVLEPDTIYVIPPNGLLSLDGLRLRVQKAVPPRGHRMPIDVFLQSLAENHDERAACVILSGSGSDGTRGLTQIKEHGGLTIAQEGASARFDGMPRSAEATGLVDHILPIAAIPRRLVDHFRHVSALAQGAELDGLRADIEERLPALCRVLNASVGHDFSQYKRGILTQRIERRMHVLQIDEVGRYVDHLTAEAGEAERLFRDLLIGVTGFLREPEMFEALERRVIPRLFEGKSEDMSVRVWVPGCATGEEAFSLAMLLIEHAETVAADIRVQVFATDIDSRALDVARRGRFPASVARQVGAERFARWFIEDDDGVRVASAIREACVFSQHNLVRDPPFSRLDLLSCRNVLFYLNHELQERVIQLLHYALRPGGYLILGPSESAAHHGKLFATVEGTHRIFKRRDVAGAAFPLTTLRAPGQRAAPAPADRQRQLLSHRVESAVLQHFAPPHVVVDHDCNVLYFSSRTSPFLSVPSGAPSSNLLDLVKSPLRAHLRILVGQAVRTRHAARRERVIFDDGELSAWVDLTVQPLLTTERDGPLLLVVFQLSSRLDSGRSPSEHHDEATPLAIKELEDEVERIGETLRTTVEELETANEELKTSNEELLSMNEELQAANEEMETSREELQSTNEELETLNVELQNKIEEVAQGHSDLKNLLESTQIATVFLDRSLRVKLFTPAARRIFRLQGGDIGRRLTDIAGRLDYPDLVPDAQAVLATLEPRERELTGRDGSVVFVRVLPYRSLDEMVEGLVITFVDITDFKRQEELLKASEATLRLTLERAPIVVCTTDLDLRYVWQASSGLRSPFGQATGRTDHELLPAKAADELVGLKRRVLETGRPGHLEIGLQGADGVARIWELVVEPARAADGEMNGLLMAGLEITDRRRSEAHEQFLLAELSHRVKNTLASIRSMIVRTLDETNSTPELREVLDGRLRALARTHDLLAGSGWQGVPLRDLIEGEVAAQRSDEPSRVELAGPDAVLAAGAVPIMALAAHELVTNAARYGALSNGAGRILVRWDLEPGGDGEETLLHIVWQEEGGPPVDEPQRSGFGRQLIERGVAYELGGTVESRFAPEGFHWDARLLASRCLKTGC